MTMTTSNEDVQKPATEQGAVGRRTVVLGAAWSVPVIAAAVATPLAAASVRSPWNVEIAAGCVLDVAGTGLLRPGFAVTADSPTDAIPSVLSVTETAVGTWSMTLPAPNLPFVGTTDPTLVPGAELAFSTFSLGYASAVVTAALVPAAAAANGPKVSGEPWVSPANAADYLSAPTFTRVYNGTGRNQTVTLSCTWDISRDLTLTGLVPGDSTYWGYFGALVPPDVRGVPGFAALNTLILGLGLIPVAGPLITSAWGTAIGSLSPMLRLNAVGAWSDAAPDHASQITNLFTFGC